MIKRFLLTSLFLLGCVIAEELRMSSSKTSSTRDDTLNLAEDRTYPGTSPIVMPLPSTVGRLPQAYDVKSYGVVGDGATNDRAALNTLINKLSSGGDLYFPAGDYSIQSGMTVPSRFNLVFAKGARLKPSNGTTVVITGPIIAPPMQIFVNALPGQGTISFSGNTSLSGVWPQWWVENTNPGTTDVTAGFQAALNTGQAFIIPEGTYLVSNLVVSTPSQRILGSGPQHTILKAAGAGKVFAIFSARTHLSFFTIDGNSMADYGIYLANNASRTTLDNLEIYKVTGSPGEGIGNEGIRNYLTYITNCEIESCKAAIHLVPSAQGSVIDHCKIFDNSGTGVYLGKGITPLFDITIANTEIEMSASGGAAKYNLVVNKVIPLTLSNIYFESAGSADSADVKVISDDSLIGMNGIYASGNDIVKNSIILEGVVSLSVSNYHCNGYTNSIPISNLNSLGRVVKLDNVDFNGVRTISRVYNN